MKLSLKKLLINKKKVNYNSYNNDIPLNIINTKIQIDSTKKRINTIILILLIYFILLSIILIFKASNLKQNNKIWHNLKFSRPDILDRNKEIVATNLPVSILCIKPKNFLNHEKSIQQLIKIIPSLNYNNIINKLNSKKDLIYIARNITPKIKDQILKIGEPGFTFETANTRFYPQKNLFSHITGNTNIDNKGISGIEKYIDINQYFDKQIILSIDSFIQHKLHENLSSAIKKFNAKSAAGIIMNTKTGEILGMVSLPDFENKNYKNIMFNPLYNNHTSFDIYEIGSIMKIFTTALAFEQNYPENKLFNVSKPFKIGNYSVEDSEFLKSILNIDEGFIYSSNIVMANIAQDLGTEKQKQFLNQIKLLNKLELELPEIGTTLTPKKWDEYNTASIGYGYSISLTLLQTLSSINGIINDGIYIPPTILKRNNTKTKSFQIINTKTSTKIKNLMKRVVTEGTGKLANLKNIEIGGKTGTSYKIIKGKYNKKKLITFFVSAFPIHSPKYTMIIMLDEANANNCITASCTTVPTSKNIIKDINYYLKLN